MKWLVWRWVSEKGGPTIGRLARRSSLREADRQRRLRCHNERHLRTAGTQLGARLPGPVHLGGELIAFKIGGSSSQAKAGKGSRPLLVMLLGLGGYALRPEFVRRHNQPGILFGDSTA